MSRRVASRLTRSASCVCSDSVSGRDELKLAVVVAVVTLDAVGLQQRIDETDKFLGPLDGQGRGQVEDHRHAHDIQSALGFLNHGRVKCAGMVFSGCLGPGLLYFGIALTLRGHGRRLFHGEEHRTSLRSAWN